MATLLQFHVIQKLYFGVIFQKDEYETKKSLQKTFIIDELLKNISDIKIEDIKIEFCATSKTFKRYINRFNCGATFES